MDATHTGIAAHQAAAVHHAVTATLLAVVHHTPHTVKCPTGAAGWSCSFKAGLHGQAVAGGANQGGISGTALLVLAVLVIAALALMASRRRSRQSS